MQRGLSAMRAVGRLKAGSMNGTEKAYAATLEARKAGGDVLWYQFEGMKFRLADNTFYTPDFIVMLRDGALEAHEVKGFWQDDARVKIKVAADRFPLRFVAVRKLAAKHGGGFQEEDF
ncbi:MAG: DUF1064 domain-containing protein [Beijerinckiaceae bacterium]